MHKKVEQISGTEPTGNTIPSVPIQKILTPALFDEYEKNDKKKHRSYCSAIYNEKDAETIKTLNYKYLIMGNEICPTTGRPHYQSYIQFKNPISKWSLQKKLPHTKLIPCAGNARQNYKYCTEEGNLHFEKGQRPYEKLSCETLKKMSYEEIIDFDPRCHQAYFHAKGFIENNIKKGQWHKNVKVYYIQGPSGIGKSKIAEDMIDEKIYGNIFNVISYENSFYQGLGSAKIAIYDEFRDSHMKASEFIKFIDYNIHIMNTKGGERQNKYELIFITSVQRLSEIYHNMTDEPRKQWERRIELIDYYNENNLTKFHSENDFLKNSIDIFPKEKLILSSDFGQTKNPGIASVDRVDDQPKAATHKIVLAKSNPNIESCENPSNKKCNCTYCYNTIIKIHNDINCFCEKCDKYWTDRMW